MNETPPTASSSSSAVKPPLGRIVVMGLPYGAHGNSGTVSWPEKWTPEVISALRASLDEIEQAEGRNPMSASITPTGEGLSGYELAGWRLAEQADQLLDWVEYAEKVKALMDRTGLTAEQVEKVLAELGVWELS